VASCNESIKIDAGKFDRWLLRGQVRAAKMQYGLAADDLTKAIELQPQSADAYFMRAENYFALKEYGSAIKDYDGASRLGFPGTADSRRKAMIAFRKTTGHDWIQTGKINKSWREILGLPKSSYEELR